MPHMQHTTQPHNSTYAHTYTDTHNMHNTVHITVHTYTTVHVHIYTYMYTYIHTCTHIYIHVHIYTHIHTRNLPDPSQKRDTWHSQSSHQARNDLTVVDMDFETPAQTNNFKKRAQLRLQPAWAASQRTGFGRIEPSESEESTSLVRHSLSCCSRKIVTYWKDHCKKGYCITLQGNTVHNTYAVLRRRREGEEEGGRGRREGGGGGKEGEEGRRGGREGGGGGWREGEEGRRERRGRREGGGR